MEHELKVLKAQFGRKKEDSAKAMETLVEEYRDIERALASERAEAQKDKAQLDLYKYYHFYRERSLKDDFQDEA